MDCGGWGEMRINVTLKLVSVICLDYYSVEWHCNNTERNYFTAAFHYKQFLKLTWLNLYRADTT